MNTYFRGAADQSFSVMAITLYLSTEANLDHFKFVESKISIFIISVNVALIFRMANYLYAINLNGKTWWVQCGRKKRRYLLHSE